MGIVKKIAGSRDNSRQKHTSNKIQSREKKESRLETTIPSLISPRTESTGQSTLCDSQSHSDINAQSEFSSLSRSKRRRLQRKRLKEVSTDQTMQNTEKCTSA